MDAKHTPKYTPGPWGIASRNYDRGDVRIATFPQAKPIARVKKTKGEDQWADARLVMEAPALISSLRELSEWMRSHTGPADGTHEMLVRAVETIARAEGRDP